MTSLVWAIRLTTQFFWFLAIPPKVEEAFKNFRYVPYTSLSLPARMKVVRGEDKLVLNANGSFTVKNLDRRNEKLISVVDWHAASRATEERIRFHHGDYRADAFAAHHKLVMDLGRSHGWEVAMDYDVQQREVAALNPSHDLSVLDTTALMIIATRLSVQHTSTQPPSPLKRGFSSDNLSSHPPKKRSRSYCFRCGVPGHFPADCKAEQTSSGKPTAPVISTACSKHAILAPNGKQFCFTFARNSSCNYGDSCSNFHGCSLCGDPSHGAGTCQTLGVLLHPSTPTGQRNCFVHLVF